MQPVCEQCGLPTPICSAIASWRKSVEAFRGGKPNKAENYATTAEEFYATWEPTQFPPVD